MRRLQLLAKLLAGTCCIAAHLAEILVTPEQFGAVGNGKANDWVPIQRALAACIAVVSISARGGSPVGVRLTGGRASIIGGSFGAHDLTSTEVEGATGVVGGGVVVF